MEVDEILSQADEVFSSPEQMDAFNRLAEASKKGNAVQSALAFTNLDA